MQRMESFVVFGRIKYIDYDAGKARIYVGPVDQFATVTDDHSKAKEPDYFITDWLPWETTRAYWNATWHPPEVGEQVKVTSAHADMSNAIIEPALNSVDAPHISNTADITKALWRIPDAEQPTYPVLSKFDEYHRPTGNRRVWVKDTGEFRQEVGWYRNNGSVPTAPWRGNIPPSHAQSSITHTRNAIILKVGDTELSVTANGIFQSVASLNADGTVNKRRAQILLTAQSCYTQVQDSGTLEIKPDAITANVKDKGKWRLLADLFEAAINGNGIVSVRENTIQAKIVPAKIRIGLFVDQIKMWAKNSWVNIMDTGIIDVRVPGSDIQLSSSGITNTSPTWTGVQAAASPAVYEEGDPSQTYVRPSAVQPVAPQPPRQPTVGKQPYRPKT